MIEISKCWICLSLSLSLSHLLPFICRNCRQF